MINGTGDSAYCAILVLTFICNHFTGKGTVPHSRLFMIGLFAYGGILLLLPGKEPDSLIECIWFRLKNSAQCRATQQVFYELFTFKIIPNLQLKLCTLYVGHFLPVLDFRAALNTSIVSADVVLVESSLLLYFVYSVKMTNMIFLYMY